MASLSRHGAHKLSEEEIIDLVDGFVSDYCDGSDEVCSHKVPFLLDYISYRLPVLDPIDDHDYIVQLFAIYKHLCARFSYVFSLNGFRLLTGITKNKIAKISALRATRQIPNYNDIMEFWTDTVFNQSGDALVDNMTQAHKGGMTQMFLAKAIYGYNDNLAPEPAYIENEAIDVTALPDLSGQKGRLLQDNNR